MAMVEGRFVVHFALVENAVLATID